jgi:hypothetical protein
MRAHFCPEMRDRILAARSSAYARFERIRAVRAIAYARFGFFYQAIACTRLDADLRDRARPAQLGLVRPN